MQPSDIYISKDEDRLLDSSPESLSPAISHGSESEVQEVVAMDGIATMSSRRFVTFEKRRGVGRGNSRGRRFTRHRHTNGQRNRKRTKRTCTFRACCLIDRYLLALPLMTLPYVLY